MLARTSGATEATTTYDPYGNVTGSTGMATTPLGYDGQYTNADTGLLYLRARSYDPKTAQFVSPDPIVEITRAPYEYSYDNPLAFVDPSGLASQYCVGATASFIVTVEVNICVVETPGGAGVIGPLEGDTGVGAGVNAHAGAGVSNAHTPGEYGGAFGTAGGSAQAGFGGYANAFAGPGRDRGVGAEGGVGGSYTVVAPL
ncbi:MAG TPA: RHS repeat-associated core domain-containing protein [Solirubrobacteraceae bacterium]|jgi:RHS repeat-associated protein|nr:RHS repeat-associated core domain-containing protein [Solirubrobacteraceae bacterium]